MHLTSRSLAAESVGRVITLSNSINHRSANFLFSYQRPVCALFDSPRWLPSCGPETTLTRQLPANSFLMDTLFLPVHVLTEDELRLCDSFPSNKYLEVQIRMVWPVRGGILRAQVQLVPCKDEPRFFEVIFHNWPEGCQLRLRDSVHMLLKGATKTPMLPRDKDKHGGEGSFSFRIAYTWGAILRVQREDDDFLINCYKGILKILLRNFLWHNSFCMQDKPTPKESPSRSLREQM